MLDLVHEPGLVTLFASGKLTRDDYQAVVPRLEREISEYGPLRLLVRLDDFHGWTPAALLDDLKFDLRHHDDVERVAVVGERPLERVATQLSQPLFRGEVRFFEDEIRARSWLKEPLLLNNGRATPTSAKVLAAVFLSSGLSKLVGAAPMRQSFDEWGYSRRFMYGIGLAEVAGAVGLLFAKTRRAAALGLTAMMGGAVGTLVSNEQSAKSLPAIGCLVAAARLAKPES